jgi:CRP/FNR family transcriptional regulator, cyclic AMP receptor protein
MTSIQLLEHADCLKLMNPEDLEALAQLLQPLNVKANQVLIREGKRSPAAFLVIEGELQVGKSLPGKQDRILVSQVPKGEWIGMVSILDGEPATATVTALSQGTVLAMNRANLETLRSNNSAMSMRFGRTVLACVSQQLLRVNTHLMRLRMAAEKQ